MGDRTTVNLTVRKDDFLKNPSLFADADDNDAIEGSSTVSLTYYDVNYGNLDFESALQDMRIPYDKSWDNGSEYTCGTEYCRVLANGCIDVKEFSGYNEDTVNLDEVIKAYKKGNIEAFLETTKSTLTVMDWDDQEIIMLGRANTESVLLSAEQANIDSLVVEMTCEIPVDLNETDDEEAQDKAVLSAEQRAVNINNQGKESQIAYLLNQGYLSQGVVKHIVPPYKLINDTEIMLYLINEHSYFLSTDQDVKDALINVQVFSNEADALLAYNKANFGEDINDHVALTPIHITLKDSNVWTTTLNECFVEVSKADFKDENPELELTVANYINTWVV